MYLVVAVCQQKDHCKVEERIQPLAGALASSLTIFKARAPEAQIVLSDLGNLHQQRRSDFDLLCTRCDAHALAVQLGKGQLEDGEVVLSAVRSVQEVVGCCWGRNTRTQKSTQDLCRFRSLVDESRV